MSESVEDRIAAKTDLTVAQATEISTAVGGLAFKDMGQVMEFAKLMAVSGQAVPPHLRTKVGACLAVSLQALNWRMDPFAVANKSYMVNDRIAYEAQLIQAVIEQRAPIKGRIRGRPVGTGGDRQWILTVVSREDGEIIEYESPKLSTIKVKNSPLWAADPDQQLWYYAARAMCRRHFPDVILGVYEREELKMGGMVDVTPDDAPPAVSMEDRLRAAKAEAEAKAAEMADTAHDAETGEVDEAEVITTPEFDDACVFPMDDAFTEGAKAFDAGAAEAANPHPANPGFSNWLAGYRGAAKAKKD